MMMSKSFSESISLEMQQNKEEQEQQHPVSDLKMEKKESKLKIALLVLRICAFVLCLKSFVVLAANKQNYGIRITDGLVFHVSFHQFKEFKYSFSVSVIACVYSLVQICDLVKYLITKKHTMDPKLRGYLNFAMDQILTYLLMSASSSAATLTYLWESEMGTHLFSVMANESVVLSFLAFVAFAFTSLVSGYILYFLLIGVEL